MTDPHAPRVNPGGDARANCCGFGGPGPAGCAVGAVFLGGLSDGALLEMHRQGCPEAYGVLFSRHHAAAVRTAWWHSRNYDVAVEAADEAFTRILSTIRAGSGPVGTFAGYLRATVTREARRQYRRRAREVPFPDDLDTQDVVAGGTGELFDPSFYEAFRSLPRRWQLVIWYMDINDMRPKEVAPLLGLTPNAVAALHRRAKAGLRLALNQ